MKIAFYRDTHTSKLYTIEDETVTDQFGTVATITASEWISMQGEDVKEVKASFTMFSKLLASKLTIKKSFTKVRSAADEVQQILITVEDAVEAYNKLNNSNINTGGLRFLAYTGGRIPRTRYALEVWLHSAICALYNHK